MSATIPRTITVSGTGRVAASPDLADLRLGVSITEGSVERARSANASAMSRVIAALQAVGIGGPDIQTTGLSLNAVYDYSGNTNPPRLTGYTVANTVAVTIRELDAVGRAIDGALEAGATSLDSIEFRVRDSSAAEREARELAVADARAKADVLAAAAGVSITGVASIGESGVAIPSPMFHGEMAKMAMSDASTPIETGLNKIAVTVGITYLIE
jgi:uncharacterized protein YggE